MMFAAVGLSHKPVLSNRLFGLLRQRFPNGPTSTWPCVSSAGLPIKSDLLTVMKLSAERKDYRNLSQTLNPGIPPHLWATQVEADCESLFVHRCDGRQVYYADLRRFSGQIVCTDDLENLCHVLCELDLFKTCPVIQMPMHHVWFFVVKSVAIEVVKLKVVSPDGPYTPTTLIEQIPIAQRV